MIFLLRKKNILLKILIRYYTQYYANQLQSTSAQSPKALAPDLSKYVFDEKSGYYYDTASNLYYDSKTQYFYNPQTQQFCYWDNDKHSFVPVSADESKTAPLTSTQEDKKEKPDKVIVVPDLGILFSMILICSCIIGKRGKENSKRYGEVGQNT